MRCDHGWNWAEYGTCPSCEEHGRRDRRMRRTLPTGPVDHYTEARRDWLADFARRDWERQHDAAPWSEWLLLVALVVLILIPLGVFG